MQQGAEVGEVAKEGRPSTLHPDIFEDLQKPYVELEAVLVCKYSGCMCE